MKRLLLCLLLLNTAFSANSLIIGVMEVAGGYQGVTADLEVRVIDGDNHVYIDTAPLSEIDTQASARLAKEVACETINVDCYSKDFFYTVRGEFPMIGGPSAGAAMTILTMAELADMQVNQSVAITGTVNPDGSVGNIGGVLEKAISASENNITLFLIPQGQLAEINGYEFPNLRVLEVSTVRDAYGYFTGVFFEELDDVIYFDEFNEFMKPLSEDLINYSNTQLNDLLLQYNMSQLKDEDSAIIEVLINSSLNQQLEIQELYDNKSYYSAASYAVGSSINSLYTIYLINYFQNNNTDYVSSLLALLNNDLESFEAVINQPFTLNHINDLEAVNIATDRFYEAKSLYNEALAYYALNDIPGALYNTAFTHVRLETSGSWLGLIDKFEDQIYIEFNQELLQDLALNRIENANTMIIYAESVEQSTYTVNANEHLINSREAYNQGNYIYSIFESLKSLSNANLAMQLRGVTIEQVSDRIELSKMQARQNINLVQSNDLMPILALSYYEYAETFEESSPVQALIFLEYSKQFSLLSIQMINSIEDNIMNPLFELPEPEEIGVQLTIIILGIISGIGLTFLLLNRLFR